MDLEVYRQKHFANDITVFMDFETLCMEMSDEDPSRLLTIWTEFPDANWSRASGHLVEDLLNSKKYNMLRMFLTHDKFRMGGKNMAEMYQREFIRE
jgi:hypothetical protein